MASLSWTQEDDSHLLQAATRLSMVTLMSSVYNAEDIYDTICESFIEASKSRSITLYTVNHNTREVSCLRNYYHHRLGQDQMPNEGSYLAKEKTNGPVYPFDEPRIQNHVVKTGEPVIIVGGTTPLLPYYFSSDDTFIRPLLDNPSAFKGKVSYFLPLRNSDPTMQGKSVIGVIGGACSLQYAETAAEWWDQCSLLCNLAVLALMGQTLAKPSLTERESQMLEFTKQGHTPQEVADKLGLSINTIFSHRTRLAKKLGVSIKQLEEVIQNHLY